MAEPEELISDAARHATVYAQSLWRRRRAARGGPQPVALADVTPRIDLLVSAVFGRRFTIRVAQPAAPVTFLTKVFRRSHLPRQLQAVPATDGDSIWLPALAETDAELAIERYRTMALQQAMRAQRGSAVRIMDASTPLARDLYLLLEGCAADAALLTMLPGTRRAIEALRRSALVGRPPLHQFSEARRPLETLVRSVLESAAEARIPGIPRCAAPVDSLAEAERLARRLAPNPQAAGTMGPEPLFRDLWTGALLPPPGDSTSVAPDEDIPAGQDDPDAAKPRTARLGRRPQVREARDDEDRERDEPGAWMMQLDQPHEHAEDPLGLQRPTDRDEEASADDYADSVSDLPEARLVASPGRPKEILLSDDPPQARAKRSAAATAAGVSSRIPYPEWDYRIGAYRDPGAIVELLPPQTGPQEWVERTLEQHRSMLDDIRRRFQMLRAHRMILRRQLDGDDLDLEACVESRADFRAGLPLAQALYQSCRPARRDMSILLLIDVSGSTDSWVTDNRRVIDVEREALLLVGIALEGLGERYAVQAFSGEGPDRVTVRAIKRFDEPWAGEIAQRIAALEPEQYTRAGAAIRHGTAQLMQEPATHRLLLLLSDGKPNDVDHYEGRYGVEDMRQAVTEAKLQGIFPFCLTIDRQAAGYLPAVFGAGHYALLPRPELLPTVLLDWMRKLLMA